MQSLIRNATDRVLVLVCCAIIGGIATTAWAQRGFGPPPAAEPEERGLLRNEAAATEGYTLFAPLNSTTTFLIDMQGQVVNAWESEFVPSAWVYLTDDGHLLRGGREPETHGFSGGGQGGRFQKFNFEGELVWEYSINTPERLPHHDVALLPNGNILAIAWEAVGIEATVAAGRRDGFIPDGGIWGDLLVELEPIGPDDARVVWEWHVFDHLIQDVNAELPNFGELAEHPGRININGDNVATANAPRVPTRDVFHINAVAYNADLDQVVVSSPTFNEIWVIDHSTTTDEARGSRGDLLYRWGNPQVYGRGSAGERTLGFQHDAKWIPEGYPGAGNLLIFNNRSPAAGPGASQVVEIAPPIDARGRYLIAEAAPFGPAEPVWSYSDPGNFNATFISGAQRLPNGNTLVTSGPQGRLFEVTADGDIVWEYWSPYVSNTDAVGAAPPANPNAIFRATRILADHPALAGRDL